MNSFTFHLPTKFIFGHGAAQNAGRELRALGGSRALVVHGRSCPALVDQVCGTLRAESLAVIALTGIKANPVDAKVYEGIALARKEQVDCVLAIGGGSVIDTAKCIAHGVCYEGDFWDFFSGKKKVEKTLPFGVVLTIAASGSESSGSAVITQESTLRKASLSTQYNRPRFALMDPQVTTTLPPYQTAAGISDILSHVMERYFTNTAAVGLTDELCEALLRAVVQAALRVTEAPDDVDARAQIMWAGTLAHNDTCGVGRSSDWACHCIEHELSARFDAVHGAGLAVVTPAWMRYVMPKHIARFAQYAVRVWGCTMDYEHPERTAQAGIDRYEDFLRRIGMPLSLEELGIPKEAAPMIAQTLHYWEGGTIGSFERLFPEDVEKILRLAARTKK